MMVDRCGYCIDAEHDQPFVISVRLENLHIAKHTHVFCTAIANAEVEVEPWGDWPMLKLRA